MIVLDILAPILLMLGISFGTSSNASLLSNFEIVATTIIALIIFKEAVSNKLWIAIFLIILASILLSFESLESFQFSFGSLFVLLATICWGMENNCTRRISSKNTYEIVILKGLFCGCGSLLIGLIIGESINEKYFILPAILLGFVSYGLSIFLYIKAQKDLGAAKTSAYYAIAPFIGVIFSFFFLKEKITINYFIALLIMIIATILVVLDTLRKQHSHLHDHSFEIKYNGSIQRFTIKHSHRHNHYDSEINHNHYHSKKELIKELKSF